MHAYRFCLRTQQCVFTGWCLVALVGWLYSADGIDLLSSVLKPAHLAAFHVSTPPELECVHVHVYGA